MPDPDHQIMTCQECLMQFEVPDSDVNDGDARCPGCGKPASPGEDDREKVNIPIARKSLNLELPEMIISNAHTKGYEGKGQNPPPVGLRHMKSQQADQPVSGPKYQHTAINWETNSDTGDNPQATPEAVNPKASFKKAPRNNKYPVKVWARFLLVAALLIVAAMAVLRRQDRDNQEIAAPNPKQAAREIPRAKKPVEEKPQPVQDPAPIGPIQIAIRKHGIRATHEKASAAVEHFLKAGTLDERKSFTRSLQRVEPLMDRYYETHNPGPIKYRSLADQHNSFPLKDYYTIGVTLEDFSMAYAILAIEQDRFLIDWESFVGYSEMSLGKFMEKKPGSPTLFRVRVKADDYYNFNFTDEQYQCLRLTNMNQTTVIYGYVMKGTGPLSTLRAGKEFFTLRLRYPESPKTANQVIIDEVITSGWVIE